LVNGELLETCFEIDALPEVTASRVTAMAVAPRYAVELLRRALALGASDAVLIQTEDLPADAHATARLVADEIALKLPTCDLVVCGDPILAAVLSGNLGREVVTLAPRAAREFTVDEYFAAYEKPLT